MSTNLRYPNITAASEREQIAQIKNYLYQLVDQLNYALPAGGGTAQTVNVQGVEMSYYDLRTLILQEVQEVQATFDELSKKFETDYVKTSGWEADQILATGQDGVVVAESKDIIAAIAAGKIAFTLDEEGNLYYEVLEETTNGQP